MKWYLSLWGGSSKRKYTCGYGVCYLTVPVLYGEHLSRVLTNHQPCVLQIQNIKLTVKLW